MRGKKYERRCKKCFGLLKQGPVAPDKKRQLFWCEACQISWEWQHNPLMDGAVCAIHKSQFGGFSFTSMSNDPCCGAFGTPPAMDGSKEYHHNAPPVQPSFVRPVFAYLDNKPIARWHWGQEKWIGITKVF